VDPDDFARAGTGLPTAASASRCDPRGPAKRASGISRRDAPIALAAPLCDLEPSSDDDARGEGPPSRGDADGRGIPKATVASMLRHRVIPVARRCLRRDRAGRLDYSVRATFHFRLADREVVEGAIRGNLTDDLRACLQQAIDSLDVPRFSGVVEVTYPIYTKRAPDAPRIEIRPDVAGRVDDLFGRDEPPVPRL
jgi:hypothetical protein